MDTYSTRHTKGRPLPKTNYYPPTYGRTYRQNDYPFSSRNSALLWHDPPKQIPQHTGRSKGKYCSIALAAATFLVLVAVLAIAGLALYMGALRTESSSPLITFLCRAKVIRGDRFIVGLVDKAGRYRTQFENLYQRSSLGVAYVSSNVDKFGNDTRTIFFRVTLNKKKIPRQIYNIEKSLKDILLADATSRKPTFPGIQFEAKSINVKRLDDLYNQRQPVNVSTKPKESTLPKRTNPTGMLTKPSQVFPTNSNNSGNGQTKTKASSGSGAPQGSFKITKTDADITEKNSTVGTIIGQASTRSAIPAKIKDTYVTSALFKLASSKSSTTALPPLRTTHQTHQTTLEPKTKLETTTLSTTTISIVLTTTSTVKPTTQKIINPFLGSGLFNEEPWVPIYHNLQNIPIKLTSTQSTPTVKEVIEEKIGRPNKEPIYTSFTNQGLSWQGLDSERLGSTRLQGHPLPVNKLSDVTVPVDSVDEIYLTTPYSIYSEVGTEFEDVIMQGIENRHGDDFTLPNVPEEVVRSNSTETETEYVEVATLKYVPTTTTTQRTTITTTTTTLKPLETSTIKSSSISTIESDNIGQAEVINADELASILATTKQPPIPLVTLLPVKSNSGVGRPIRPRPKRPNETEIRSFTTKIDQSGLGYVQTEVVTSVSQEQSKPKPKPKNPPSAFQIVGVLNFATEIPTTQRPEDPKAETETETITPTPEDLLKMEAQPFQQILTPEKLAELSKISKLHLNTSEGHNVISTKAVQSGSEGNGFNMLTKTYNKIPLEDVFKEEKTKYFGYNPLYFESINASECSNYTIQCGDGQCLPNSTRCNNLVDCADGSDERDCNCADYLRSQFLLKKICDGIVDCWDFSDENRCDWCQPGQYVCGNSKTCINRTSICDGITDCPHGDDERQCVTVAPDLHSADEYPYNEEGYLMVRKNGNWGKLCVENFSSVISKSRMSWKVSDLGQAVCKAMTYKKLETTNVIKENVFNANYEETPYYELSYSFNNETKSSLSFENTTCEGKEVVLVKCESLECGVRPQIEKKNARIVGGGNAGLGAWPWQTALYKEGEFQCGGTLISERWILSAGHCFYHSQKDHWIARMGNLRRGTSLPSPYEQLRNIISINLHPDYVDVGFINDISLLQMEAPVIFSDYVRPVCLPPAGVPPIDGRICTVIGWGQLFEIGRIFPDTLQEVQVPIISTAECRKRTLFLPLYQVTDDMFCAGYDRGGRDACLGDSGGPLMCSEADGRWTLHGITSNGYGCARAFRPGVYTKVANYINWIQLYLQSNTNQSVDIETKHRKIDKCNGHRCPLGECLPKSRICNGFIECSDGSDENGCLKTSKR